MKCDCHKHSDADGLAEDMLFLIVKKPCCKAWLHTSHGRKVVGENERREWAKEQF